MSSNRHNQFTPSQRLPYTICCVPCNRARQILCRSSLIHMTVIERHQPARHRTIFISDIHLGTRGCKAELLLDFLRRNESEHLYLVGDIVDGWRLRRSWYWPQAHNDVVQKVLRKARKGTQRRSTCPATTTRRCATTAGSRFGGVDVVDEAIHETADGRRFLVIHGDHFDGVVRYARWLAFLGDCAYARRRCALNHWLQLAPRAARPALLVAVGLPEAQGQERGRVHRQLRARGGRARRARRGVDGVVCGHIHKAEIRDDRRRPLLQRRRLGGELHGAGRASRRPRCEIIDWAEACAQLGGAAARSTPRCAAERRDCASSSSPTPGAADQRRGAHADDTCARAASARAMRSRCLARTASAPCPARPIRRSGWRCCPRRGVRAHDRRVRARRDPHRRPRDRWAGRRARYCLQPRPALHHRLSHALSRICARAHPACRSPGATPAAPVPRAVGGGDGGDAVDPRRARRARLPQSRRLVARRRYRAVPARDRTRRSSCRGRSTSMSAASRWRRTSRRSSSSICRARKLVVGDGPQLPELQRRYPEVRFVGAGRRRGAGAALRRGRRLRLSRAAPTPSAW